MIKQLVGILTILLAPAGLTALVHSQLIWSASAEGSGPSQARLALHAPLSPAVLDRAGALEAARQAGYTDDWLNRPGVSVEYGSYNPRMIINGQPTSTVDAWKITIPGLDLPRPSGPIGSPPAPHIHVWVIFIADKTGKSPTAYGF